jgi:hypothetical protein
LILAANSYSFVIQFKNFHEGNIKEFQCSLTFSAKKALYFNYLS